MKDSGRSSKMTSSCKWSIDNELRVPRCKIFLLKMSFICRRIKTNFNINSFARHILALNDTKVSGNPEMAYYSAGVQFRELCKFTGIIDCLFENRTVAIFRLVNANKRQNNYPIRTVLTWSRIWQHNLRIVSYNL